MTTSKPRLTWSYAPYERGAFRQSNTRILKVNGTKVGTVSEHHCGFHETDGWYWCARCDELGIPIRNSLVQPTTGVKVYGYKEGAQYDCAKYVRECLERAQEKASEK